MIHLLQSLSDGKTHLVDVPVPSASGPQLVVQSRATIVSAGTERMLVEFGRASLLEKARRQPEKVRQVLDKVRAEGLGPTVAAVRAKLDAPIPLGYCQAGTVVETGPRVERFVVGDRVVTNGPHAEYVRVPHTLAARIPRDVSFEAAAFTPLAAIALQGFRLANPTVGETVVVYGLGLIGLLAVQIARAAGCDVIGIDRDGERALLAERFGARVIVAPDAAEAAARVMELTTGEGADAVLLTLATDSDEPVHAAAEMARQRGRLVLVGVAGLRLKREDFYRKELSFQVSCSYGPGRYDPQHEERGIDYPPGLVRWTEGRNFEAVLSLMSDRRVDPLPLISHRFPIEHAARAYDVVSSGAPSLGIVLSYPDRPPLTEASARTIMLRAAPARPGKCVVGWIGAGNFASRVLIPAFAKAGATLDALASSGGVSASVVGQRTGFHRATTDSDSLLGDPKLDTIVVSTRHDSHADWAARALRAGKHVFVEKPLALTMDELSLVSDALQDAPGLLCVGFNRRAAPMITRTRDVIRTRPGPLTVSLTINAGRISGEHWTQDREVGGGRIVGEACHFIDLARYFVGAPIRRLQVTTASAGGAPVEDIALLQLSFADGSIATIQYLANGPRDFPKERIELVRNGAAVRIDNYRRLEAWGISVTSSRWPSAPDKGHAALARAFVAAVREGGPPPIPLDELLEVSAWSIRAAELASRGGGEHAESAT